MERYEKDHVWYMWKRGKDELIIGDDIAKTQKDYFLGDRKPDLQMTEQELDDCGRMVRVIDGGIVVGRTEKEKEEDRRRAEAFAKMYLNIRNVANEPAAETGNK